ncbi:lysophospholipid acyltransferase family protein [Bacteroidetes bacterium endosymbiont of Geopemphigus sp.]|uniref:lysophospholipid acyltransferase family protein n=1 Tax=Bacteroidetes bacterium endosymbiont of Geopemphigus sp. TaxID=2047937 RepID=UPI000CD2B413|nr:lysophospholipid acyltransferase family protein [Bacteroidetes bacterium endosymbiont of Geopemphigus sp.]
MKKRKSTLFQDIFGNIHVIKRSLIFIFGCISYNRYNGFNKLKLKGTEELLDLPDRNVLFVSNHQTYFADVFAMYHVFCSVKNGFVNTIKNPIYLFNPKINLYYVAAKETMSKGWLTKLFTYSGAIIIKRTWRESGKDINRPVDISEITRIGVALNDGWLITFPQGTTTPFAPGRRGVIHIIRKFNPVVIPIVIDGFQDAYDKKGLKIKEKGILQKMTFKSPLTFDFEKENADQMLVKIMDAIEQSPRFRTRKEKSSLR